MDPNAQNPTPADDVTINPPAPAVDPNAPVQAPVMPGSDQPVGDPMGTPAPVDPAMPEPQAPVEPTPTAPAEGVGDAGTGMPPAVPPAV